MYRIKCCDGKLTYTRLTEHKQATRNGDFSSHIAEHHVQTKHQIGRDSATCIYVFYLLTHFRKLVY